jgi:hypothetical protein
MVVIVHQHKGMNLKSKTIRQLGHQTQETASVGVIAKERASPMPSIQDMIPGPGHIDSQSSCHAGAFNRAQDEMSIV